MTKLIMPQLMTLQKEAMKSKDKLKTKTLRAIGAAFKQICVDEKKSELSEVEEITVLKKMIKQRLSSADEYKKAQREDLVLVELYEVSIIEQFLPSQMSEEDIKTEVLKVLETFDEKPTMKQMGLIMSKLGHLKSVADMSVVNSMVRKEL